MGFCYCTWKISFVEVAICECIYPRPQTLVLQAESSGAFSFCLLPEVAQLQNSHDCNNALAGHTDDSYYTIATTQFFGSILAKDKALYSLDPILGEGGRSFANRLSYAKPCQYQVFSRHRVPMLEGAGAGSTLLLRLTLPSTPICTGSCARNVPTADTARNPSHTFKNGYYTRNYDDGLGQRVSPLMSPFARAKPKV